VCYAPLDINTLWHLSDLPELSTALTAHDDIMHFSSIVLTTLLASIATVAARDVPANVRSFYNKVKNQDRCPNQLQGGFHSRDNDNKGILSPFPQHLLITCWTHAKNIYLHDQHSATAKTPHPASSTWTASASNS
jgi:hypothetical protein